MKQDEARRIETNFLGLRLKSPCIVASSFLTADLRRIVRAEAAGAGGISTKLALLEVPFPFRADILILQKEMGLVTPGDKRINVEEAIRLIEQVKKNTQLIVIANMLGPALDLPSWQRLGKGLESAGADILELDLSCPNVSMTQEILSPKGLSRWTCIAQYPDLTEEVTRAVKSAVQIPVLCKLTPCVTNFHAIGLACQEGGADGIVAINGLPAAPPIDIHNKGKPLYMALEKHSFGGMTGASIFPVACRMVADMAQVVRIPIIGCGGIISWSDAVQMIMWGASALEICTAIILDGFDAIEKINEGLERFMEEEGYFSIEDFRGLALHHLAPPDQLEFKNVRLSIQEDRCNQCLRCLHIGNCLAISLYRGVPFINQQECMLCGICRNICPQHAIEIEA